MKILYAYFTIFNAAEVTKNSFACMEQTFLFSQCEINEILLELNVLFAFLKISKDPTKDICNLKNLLYKIFKMDKMKCM